MKRNLLLAVCFCVFFGSNLYPQTSISKTKLESKSTSVKNGSEIVTAEEAAKKALNVGAKIPSFILPNAKNELMSSEDLLKEGNLVLVFYRGAWCPYCNTYLKKLQNNLEQINANGGKLVAVSVENPDASMAVAKKNEVEFTVLSDKHLDLARRFGIVYQLSAESNDKYKGFGIDLVTQNGTETPDLPLSATYVVNQSGEITYAFLEPDYKKRAEPADIIETLKRIKNLKAVKSSQKSVTVELNELTNATESQVPPKIIEAGKQGTAELTKSGILESALNVGGRMPMFSLMDANNELVNSSDLLKQGHLIVVFYRGAWCPFCNLYLRGMQKNLSKFKEQGANLVAISVENPDTSLSVAQENKLDYTVLSDPKFTIARKFGIVYEMPKVTNDVILELGFDLAKHNRTEKAELPLSATYVVSKSGDIVYTFLDADYKKRADPSEIIDVLVMLNEPKKSVKGKN